MYKITSRLALLFTIVFFPSLKINAQQPKVFLPLLETINLKKDFQYSSTRLLKNYIESANKYQVIMQGNNDSSISYDNQNATIIAKAKEKNAAYYITGSLNRLGENVIVNINLYETETGKKVWFDQLKAFTPDDLDPILQRVGQNIGTENKATTTDDIYSVTNLETQQLKKKESNNSFGIGLSGLALFGDQSSSSVVPGLSLVWSFDARDYIFDVKTAWNFNNTRDVYSLSIEMEKPIYTKGNSPFLGGGLAFSRTAISDDYSSYYGTSTPTAKGYGLMALAGGGYIFNRTSSVSLRISANYMLGFYDVKGNEYSYYSGSGYTVTPDKNYGWTNGLLVRLEILFRK